MEKKHHLQAKLNLPMLMCRKNYIYIYSNECIHNSMSQKGRRTANKNNQNLINIYVLPFQAMIIMENNYFFIRLNVKEFF